MSILCVFVGDKKMVKAGKPFVVARSDTGEVIPEQDGLSWFEMERAHVLFKSNPEGRIFHTKDGYEYTVHAWVELSIPERLHVGFEFV